MSKKIDLTGKVFGRLTVIKEAGRNNSSLLWLCRCECGVEKIIQGNHLKEGKILSCGCYMKEKSSLRITERNITHGLSKTRFYKIWSEMLRRCFNQNAANYSMYGGRGIKVCDEWKSFEGFYKDMYSGYKKGLSIDRIDVNGNYCKENCRWLDAKGQARNRRNTIFVNGVSLSELCEEKKLDYGIVWQRIHKSKWSVEKALSTPINKRMCLK